VQEAEYGGNIMYYVWKWKNETPETISGRDGEKEWIKENDGGVNSTMIYYKNFCKCHNVSPVQ
jgi:hypothetical protein